MEPVKVYSMIASDAIDVVIRDEKTILRQRAAILVLGIICGLLAVTDHGKKHN